MQVNGNWYPYIMSGWLVIGRRIGVRLVLRRFALGFEWDSVDISIFLGPMTISLFCRDPE